MGSSFVSSLINVVVQLLTFPWAIADKRRSKRRQTISERQFPAEWKAILKKNFPLYRLMPAELGTQLERRILVFLNEKRFEGCRGQEITDEVKVTIAAPACMLLLNQETDYYPRFSTILVYPRAYLAAYSRSAGPAHLEGEDFRIGESWHRDYVVLSWEDVKQGNRNVADGNNVAVHEFAHQLDQESGYADGIPLPARYTGWARVLSREYKRFCRQLSAGRDVLLDEYGATEPAEFFAVVTETFFEKPAALRQRHPELYEELAKLYRVDPAGWLDAGTT